MQEISPLLDSTKVRSNALDWSWRPDSFESFIQEFEHIASSISNPDRLILYRGQRDCVWPIDSTIARSLKKHWLQIPADEKLNHRARESIDLHRLLVSAVLWKFLGVIGPSEELLGHETRIPELDSMFELMKRLQQYPEKEPDWIALPGTPLVDWSESKEIGLFFANWNRAHERPGAVYVFDATESGKVLQTLKVSEILAKLAKTINERSPGLPLLFSPPKQILTTRAKRQKACYFAHMDMRYDLAQIWRLQERALGRRILLKLVLPAKTNDLISRHLEEKGLTEGFVMVEE